MSTQDSKNQDPHLDSLCTWKDVSNCDGCEISGVIQCRWNRKRVLNFFGIYLLFTIPSWYGLILLRYWGGIGVFALTYLVFSVVYFIFIEMLVLCSHCPYYNKKGKFLQCQSSKHGMPKIWKYNPGPLNNVEKAFTLFGMLIFLFFPTIAISYGLSVMWIQGSFELWRLIIILVLDIISVIGGINFIVILKRNYCSKCMNFSCPLNTVPKELVDAYLRKNPVMRKAWEEAGYQLS